jgi:hypothetical protein
MLNILSLLFAGVALLFALPGILPFLGWLNWMAIPIALVGVVLGVLSRRTSGRNVSLVVLIAATVRLMLGGGIL